MNEREETPVYIGSWKGRVIKSIVVDGAKTWDEIRNATGLSRKNMQRVLAELFHIDAIKKTERGEYRVDYDLYKEYKNYFERKANEEVTVPKVSITEKDQKRLITWIDDYIKLKSIEGNLKNLHLYLDDYLSDFSKDAIMKAKSEVMVVSPFVSQCNLGDTLTKAVKNNVSVSLVHRTPDNDKDEKYHKYLKDSKVKTFANERVHAKIIVVDRALAIVSSMNFTTHSDGGHSLEAGIVTIDPDVVQNVTNWVLQIIERPDSIKN